MGVGEFDEVDADVVAGGYVVVDGFLEELGVGGSGDDCDVVATCGNQARELNQWDLMALCEEWEEVYLQRSC